MSVTELHVWQKNLREMTRPQLEEHYVGVVRATETLQQQIRDYVMWHPIKGNKPDLPHDCDEIVQFYANGTLGMCEARYLIARGATHWAPTLPPPRG